MSNCTVQLDNYQGQYYGGNTIVGRVICAFSSPKSVRAIKIKLLGKEHTDWTEEESYYDDNDKQTKYRTVYYSGNNTILFMEQTLSTEGDYPVGRYEYPFSFVLPTRLPSTFKNQYGYIKYYVKAIVDRPYRMDYESEREINFVSPIDFNTLPGVSLDPVAYSDDKTICCFCCASGPITMKVYLEKQAFVAGESARVKVEITNLSNVNVEGIKANIITTIVSKVTSPSSANKYSKELEASDVDTGVGAHGERSYNFELAIPQSASIPNFICSTLFSNYSILQVTAKLPGCHRDLNIETSVTLGHIPRRGHEPFPNAPVQQTSYPVPPYSPPQNGIPQGTPYPPEAAYSSENNCPPPYQPPAPSHAFPKIPDPSASGHIGFSDPSGTQFPLKSSLKPDPTSSTSLLLPSASSGFNPNAPPQDCAPSAPSKAQIAEDGDFILLDETNEPVPPSYNEAMQKVMMPRPS